MKISFIIFILFSLFYFTGYAPQSNSSLQGEWELVSGHSIRQDSTAQYHPRSKYTRQIKIIGTKYYSWVRQDTSMNISGFGAGPYTLKGDNYTEKLELFHNKTFIGHSLTFKMKVKGDTLIQTGLMSLKKLGLGDYDYQLREVYVRIK